MMKTRTNNPPARTASGTVSHQDTLKVKYMRNHSATYGTTVFTICQRPRRMEGV